MTEPPFVEQRSHHQANAATLFDRVAAVLVLEERNQLERLLTHVCFLDARWDQGFDPLIDHSRSPAVYNG